MIFDDTTEEKNYVTSYWLDSPGVTLDSEGRAYFGPGAVYEGFAYKGYCHLFVSNGALDAREFAVRPVVSLKSEVTVEDIKVISGTEEEWAGEGPRVISFERGNIKEGKIE